jgi:hypothetical protein
MLEKSNVRGSQNVAPGPPNQQLDTRLSTLPRKHMKWHLKVDAWQIIAGKSLRQAKDVENDLRELELKE